MHAQAVPYGASVAHVLLVVPGEAAWLMPAGLAQRNPYPGLSACMECAMAWPLSQTLQQIGLPRGLRLAGSRRSLAQRTDRRCAGGGSGHDAGPCRGTPAGVVASQAASRASGIAHAIFGAMGITVEHDLQLFTRRLQGWRTQYGSEDFWSARVGQALLAGSGNTWDYARQPQVQAI